MFRLHPSSETTQIISYCLALALAKTQVVLHAACFMSNHYHLVVTDPRGLLPDFLRELNRSIAKALNLTQGEAENLWAAEPASAVLLGDDEDAIKKIAYVVANPVAAGLVELPEEWPGLRLWGESAKTISRPDRYFSRKGSMPETLELRVAHPRSGDAPRESWRRRVSVAIRKNVVGAHARIRESGRRFLGRRRVLAQLPTQQPDSKERRPHRVPSIAAADRTLRSAAATALRAFRLAYREALSRWREGARDVIFPFGTWWMRVHHHALTAHSPAQAASAA